MCVARLLKDEPARSLSTLRLSNTTPLPLATSSNTNNNNNNATLVSRRRQEELCGLTGMLTHEADEGAKLLQDVGWQLERRGREVDDARTEVDTLERSIAGVSDQGAPKGGVYGGGRVVRHSDDGKG